MLSSKALLSATCLVPVLAMAFLPAQGHTQVVDKVEQGSDGKPGSASIAPTDGSPGASIILTNGNTTPSTTSGSAVLLISRGGAGGTGSTVRQGRGGQGGEVSLTQTGNVSAVPPSGPFAQTTSALISLLSEGGAGGSGSNAGAGGNASRVTVNLQANAAAFGNGFSALWAKSIGGNAGRGGTDNPGTATGGAGGNIVINIARNVSVSTTGTNAPAIYAQSLGGSGVERQTSLADPFVSDGGNAGTISFTNRGVITTTGSSSSGVLLLSQGGQGGVQRPTTGGQNGGNGGNGGQIVANQLGSISTSGSYSFGLVAQSLGGSGGKGADAFFSAGNGGNAGSGGAVTVTNTGTITTTGTGSAAIVANSMGGGSPVAAFQSQSQTVNASGAAGGNAGFLFFGSAGRGGSGANGGSVTVYNSGNITTSGTNANGILAQSVGGGGGNGGSAKTVGLFLSIADGGNGGGGGNGGSVTVLPSAGWALPQPLSNLVLSSGPSITTSGDSATAIFAQSIGGGGGTGGAAWTGSLGAFVDASIAVGGTGGLGGNGGAVNVGNLATLDTSGNSAPGIFAQSLGGGGGVAGSATSTAISVAAELPAIGVTVSVGGSGGGGGSGGAVTIGNIGSITTSGQQSPAIMGQSVGGGGGSGGAAAATTKLNGLDGAIGTAVAVGGSGGGGGSGGTASITNEGQLSTQGAFSNGISVQSIGGGGGDGGAAEAATSTGFDIPTTVAELKQFGVSGPVFQNGGTAALDAGILKSIPPAPDLGPAVSFDYALGGSGGSGGAGGVVDVTNSGSIQTSNTNSNAIFAQSVGGGGGSASGLSGSTGKTGAVSAGGGGTELSLALTLGGKGGNGGNGGAVTVTNSASGTIQTQGAGSSAIVAQSIGGGGGSAGSMGVTSSANTFAISSVDKASTDVVKAAFKYAKLIDSSKAALKNFGIQNQQAVFSWLDRTIGTAFFAPLVDKFNTINADAAARRKIPDKFKTSVAGTKVSIPLNLGINVAIGGKGGGGGNGGSVATENDGSITTVGDQADGILAQSIGGGGGVGGSAYVNQANQFNFGVSVGGTGGAGGLGGSVAVTNTGGILTIGDLSQGILAQSVGGGGGVGGVSSGGAAALSLSATVKVGGSGGTSQDAGGVTVTNTGFIGTLGNQSQGIMAQSIGGGGGLIALEGTPSIASNSTGMGGDAVGTSTLLSLTPSVSVPFAFGGSGGSGGNGGSVIVTNGGIISTSGRASFGIFAQSIGGGGGVGVNSQFVPNIRLGSRLGASGAGGNGGAVTVSLMPQSGILTEGNGSAGLVAQSVGGGGGYSGTASWLVPTINSTAAAGNGGAINVTVDAPADQQSVIITTGKQADGMYLQSLGGGGGLITNAVGPVVVPENSSPSRTGSGGSGGAITVNGNGIIIASGQDASAIIAQSGMQKADGSLDPSRQGGNISITWNGALQGGSGTGVGVLMDGGANNTLTLGAGSTLSALSGSAIQATFGNDTVNDAGTITGNINLYGGRQGESNALNILPGGTLNSGSIIGLGPIGTFTNMGLLNVAGQGVVGATAVNGNFTNNGGAIGVDANFASKTADVLNVSGAAQLTSGTMNVNLLGIPQVFSPTNMPALPVVTGSSVTIGSAMTVTPTLVLAYGLAASGPAGNQTASLQIQNADFLPASVKSDPGFTADMQSEAAGYQKAWNDGNLGADTAQFLSLVAATTPAQYLAQFRGITNEEAATPGSTTAYAADQFQNTLHSCPVFVEDTTLLNEQDCVYLRNIDTGSQLTADSGYSRFSGSSVAFEIGGEKQVSPGWFLGGAISPGSLWSQSAGGLSEVSGTTVNAGMVVKHFVTERLLLAASASYGNDNNTLSDVVETETGNAVATAQQELNHVTGRLRAEYDIPFETWYIRPMVDADVTYTSMAPYTETGAGIDDVSYSAANKTTPSLSPTIEFGTRVGNRAFVGRLYADIGMSWFVNPDWVQSGIFVGLPDGSFDTSSDVPSLVGRLALGAQVIAWHNVSIDAEYDGEYSPNYTQNGGSIKLDYRF